MEGNNLKRKSSGDETSKAKKANLGQTTDEILQKKEKELQDEKESFLNGTNPEFVERCAKLEAIRDKHLSRAKENLELQISEAEAIYAFEKKAAEDSYNTAKEDLKQQFLAEVDDSFENLEALKSAGNDEQSRASSRKLRSKATRGSEYHMELDRYGTRRNGKNAEGSTMRFAMTEDDIIGDLKDIYNDWRDAAESKLTDKDFLHQMVRYERGKLIVNEQILEKGTFVVVNDRLAKTESFGAVSSVTPDEIFVKLVDNSKNAILLRDIRSGRCSIARDHEDDK